MKESLIWLSVVLCCAQYLNAGHYIGDYYVSHPLTGNWWEASRFCTYYGKHLIDIPDELEYRNVLKVIDQVQQNDSNMSTQSVWTSGVRFADEKYYYWETTGQPVIYADWVPGDPQYDTDKCLLLWNGNNYKLADGICDAKLVFICQGTAVD